MVDAAAVTCARQCSSTASSTGSGAPALRAPRRAQSGRRGRRAVPRCCVRAGHRRTADPGRPSRACRSFEWARAAGALPRSVTTSRLRRCTRSGAPGGVGPAGEQDVLVGREHAEQLPLLGRVECASRAAAGLRAAARRHAAARPASRPLARLCSRRVVRRVHVAPAPDQALRHAAARQRRRRLRAPMLTPGALQHPSASPGASGPQPCAWRTPGGPSLRDAGRPGAPATASLLRGGRRVSGPMGRGPAPGAAGRHRRARSRAARRCGPPRPPRARSAGRAPPPPHPPPSPPCAAAPPLA